MTIELTVKNPRKKSSTPPINTALTNKLQGSTTLHNVERWHLENEVIRRKRRGKGYGDTTIANEINALGIAGEGNKLNGMAVNRWWRKYTAENKDQEDIVNIYGSSVSLLKSIESQMEVLDMYIGDINSEVGEVSDIVAMAKHTKDLMLTYEKLSQRKMALLGQIGAIQEKVYGYMAIQRMAEIVMETVEEQCGSVVYDAVMEKFKDNKEYQELLRKICVAK